MNIPDFGSGLALLAASDATSFGAVAWLFWKQRQDHERAIEKAQETNAHATQDLRQHLADFKLEVARSYVSMAYLKDVESRLTAHLLRIEAKLDSATDPRV